MRENFVERSLLIGSKTGSGLTVALNSPITLDLVVSPAILTALTDINSNSATAAIGITAIIAVVVVFKITLEYLERKEIREDTKLDKQDIRDRLERQDIRDKDHEYKMAELTYKTALVNLEIEKLRSVRNNL
ncbi:TPA: hypothetical protein DEP96_03425 [Candidatus Uhrbacteria bacterium]|nr:hypothetical protein [Candidatus Uhrbacteria bacterium]